MMFNIEKPPTKDKTNIENILNKYGTIDANTATQQEGLAEMENITNTLQESGNESLAQKTKSFFKNLGEKVKKGILIGGTALGVTVAATSPAFGEQLAQNGSLHIRNPHEMTLQEGIQGKDFNSQVRDRRIILKPKVTTREQNSVLINTGLNNAHIGEVRGNNIPSNFEFQSNNDVDRNDIYADPTSDVGIGGININNYE